MYPARPKPLSHVRVLDLSRLRVAWYTPPTATARRKGADCAHWT
jgi:hypothetical protein